MVALNFKKEFVPAIKSGRKTRTVRAIRKAGNPRYGDALQLYTGMRTKKCQKIAEVRCLRVRPVTIEWLGAMVGGKQVKRPRAFAREDGFTNYMEMAFFFDQTYGLPFHGQMIEWIK